MSDQTVIKVAAPEDNASANRVLPVGGARIDGSGTDGTPARAAADVRVNGTIPGGTVQPVLALTDSLDNVAPSADPEFLGTIARLTGLDADAAQWDRIRSLADNADGQAELTQGLLATVARLQGFNTDGNTWQRLRAIAESESSDTNAALVTLGRLQGWDDVDWLRLRVASGENIANHGGEGALITAPPGEWSEQANPAVGVLATVTRAAGGGTVRHVCRSIQGTLIVTGAAANGSLVLRDGATGVGTILWSCRLFGATSGDRVAISGLNIVGSANTAMTLEFTGAPGGADFQNVALTGYDVF
jgi:hypothetical protein